MTMREKFEAWFDREYPHPPIIPELRGELREAKWPAWQAAYAAGMTRAAEIADDVAKFGAVFVTGLPGVEEASKRIRAEITKGRGD